MLLTMKTTAYVIGAFIVLKMAIAIRITKPLQESGHFQQYQVFHSHFMIVGADGVLWSSREALAGFPSQACSLSPWLLHLFIPYIVVFDKERWGGEGSVTHAMETELLILISYVVIVRSITSLF